MSKKLVLLLLFILTTQTASAYSSGGGGEENHLISVGGGISSPSVTSAISENPAGLSGNTTFKLLGEIGTDNTQFDPIGFGGGLFAGNGTVGGGITVQNFSNFNGGLTGSSTLLDFGLAAEITALNLSFGVSAADTVASSGTGAGGGLNSNFGFNAGIIYNPHGQWHFGAAIFGLTDGVDSVTGGFSYDASPQATFAIDTSYAPNSQTLEAKPGFEVRLQPFHMAVGYAFRVVNSGYSQFPTGLSLALGIPISKKFALQFYYNQLALYYGGITISL